MRNPLFSKKLKRSEARLLIIDDNQIRFNQICDQLKANDHIVVATLLDDVKNFEKQLNAKWDLIIFGRAYDLKVDQAIALIRSSSQPDLPLLLLTPDDYEPSQYTDYIRQGIYDIVNINYEERFYYGIIRTLSFSRLQQQQEKLVNELETAQIQAQSLVEDSNKAIAIIQEGIHIQANSEYLELFNIKDESEIIGLPLLDLIQPKNLSVFKTRFKKASQGQFDLGAFDVQSQNVSIKQKNPLNIEFLSASEEDAIQITIDIEGGASSSTISTVAQDSSNAANIVYQQINRTIKTQPAPRNALVVFSLASCPEQIFQADWATSKSYFLNIRDFIKEQTQVPLFKIDTSVYAGLFQAESQEILNSKLIGLNSLAKPQLLNVNEYTYPLNLRIGYSFLGSEIANEAQLEQYIAQAFATKLPVQAENDDVCISLDFETPAPQADSLDFTEIVAPDVNKPTTLRTLASALEKGEIHLKYQQLYDKQDTNLYTYEVTSSFIDNSEWRSCCNISELAEDPELSIKLDRWILVESCKQLHNFITQYPDAKLVINLNKQILLQDRAFPDFVAKLISIIGSRVDFPLILQFSEDDIHQHLGEAQKQIALLRQHGAEISLRDFGKSAYSESVLKQLDVNCLSLHVDLTNMLNSEKTTEQLAEKLSVFQEIRPVEILLRELNDMNLFANAWNVDARFIQGDYFQKKLDQLIDVQDQ